MNTAEKIKGFIKEEYKSAFLSDRLKVFEYDHRKLSEDYPAGKKAYFKNELFLLKKEYINPSKYAYYTVNWIRCDCFEFDYLEGFQHLMDNCKKTFVRMFEFSVSGFKPSDYKEGTTIEFFYNNRLNYIEAIIKEFYTCASKIRSLEKMMNEEEVKVNASTLWDFFIDRSNGIRIKNILIANQRWDGDGTYFKPKIKGTKYEPASLYKALDNEKYLVKINSDVEIIEILKRTFHKYSCDDKTFRKGKNDTQTVDYYRAICKRI